MTVSSDTITAALRVTRQNCAALAERLLALGRGDEIPRMILAGIAPDRIPPLAEPAPPAPAAHAAKSGASGPGFDPEVSKRRFEEQTRRAAPAS